MPTELWYENWLERSTPQPQPIRLELAFSSPHSFNHFWRTILEGRIQAREGWSNLGQGFDLHQIASYWFLVLGAWTLPCDKSAPSARPEFLLHRCGTKKNQCRWCCCEGSFIYIDVVAYQWRRRSFPPPSLASGNVNSASSTPSTTSLHCCSILLLARPQTLNPQMLWDIRRPPAMVR